MDWSVGEGWLLLDGLCRVGTWPFKRDSWTCSLTAKRKGPRMKSYRHDMMCFLHQSITLWQS